MHFGDRDEDLWALPYSKLAQECHRIADDTSGTIDAQYGEEAKILSAAWKEALAPPERGSNFEEAASRKISLLEGLRRRTIEVIVTVWDKLPEESK